jgi:integrase/recombinase XerD
MTGRATPGDLAPLLQSFFTDKLIRQRQASPHTIAAYCDTITILLDFTSTRTRRPPAHLGLADLDAATIGAFLHHLTTERGNSAATRNARLAAIHSLFRHALPRAPEHAALIQRVLAIPPTRRERAIVDYLTRTGADALIAAPDTSTWLGRRDHKLLEGI